jgi:hypothetical protein
MEPEIAREKGRLFAAHVLARNPEQRKMMEDIWGKAAMQRRYPELYSPSPFEERLIDKISFSKG